MVYINAHMDSTRDNNEVEVDLWYSTSLDLGDRIADELASMSLSFEQNHNGKNIFTPRIATYPCLNCEFEFIE